MKSRLLLFLFVNLLFSFAMASADDSRSGLKDLALSVAANPQFIPIPEALRADTVSVPPAALPEAKEAKAEPEKPAPAETPAVELSTAAPVQAESSPVPEKKEYEIGVDDVLDINILKPVSITTTVIVAPDGAITVPYIGNVHAKGSTVAAIQEQVQNLLADGYMEFPVVSVSLRETRSRKFVVYGAVARPGEYPVGDAMTIVGAITGAGGLISPGSTGKVMLLKQAGQGAATEKVNSTIARLMNGDFKDVIVSPGDTIIVSLDKFYISGQVARSGLYPVEEGMTLLNAVTLAGGFTESRASGRVKLFRPKAGGDRSEIIDVTISRLLAGYRQDVAVLGGDTVVVTTDKFFISGEVARPGSYPVEEDMTLLQAVTLAGGFTEARSSGTVKLLSPAQGGGKPEVRECDIRDILKGACQELAVRAGDTVVVSLDHFYVYGEVARPGRYPLENSTTAVTGISMAGGFTKFGSASHVKVLTMNAKTSRFDTQKVNINEALSGSAGADILLKPGDIVVVSEGVF